MKTYLYIVIFITGEKEQINAGTPLEAVIQAQSVQIDKGSDYNIDRVNCPETEKQWVVVSNLSLMSL